jgi:hypothetical protein
LREDDLLGRWEEASGPGAGAGAFIEFFADKTVQFRFRGGENLDLPPNVALKYRFDPTITPPWLDLIVESPDGRELFAIKMIVDAVELNAIRIASTNDPNERPSGFIAPGTIFSGKLFKVR